MGYMYLPTNGSNHTNSFAASFFGKSNLCLDLIQVERFCERNGGGLSMLCFWSFHHHVLNPDDVLLSYLDV